MDIPTIIAKVVGAGLLIMTLRSVYQHVRERREARRSGKSDHQSVVEMVLNNFLLYAWLAFMLVFSTGMIVNN